MSDERRRRRFTLRDLFALVTIAGVLLAISVPYIQASRESARRDQCSIKLKQLGQALHNHHDVYRKFPPVSYQGNRDGQANVGIVPGSGNSGTAAGFLADPGTASGYSWIVRILPYLQEPVYSDISTATQRFTVDGWSNRPPFQITLDGIGRHFSTIPLDAVVCPSYRGSMISTACSGISNLPSTVTGYSLPRTGYKPFSGTAASPPYGVVITNYVALSATTSLNMPGADTADGTIIPGNGLRLISVLDGISNTLIACETKEPAFNSWYDGTTAWTTATPAGTVLTTNADGQHVTVPAGGITSLQCSPFPSGPSRASRLYAPSCYTTAGFSGQSGSIAWGPSSNHAGGVVLHLTCTAAVSAITTDIDPTLYVQLVSRAGREPVAAPDVN